MRGNMTFFIHRFSGIGLETVDDGGLIAAAIASGTSAPSVRRVAADELAVVEDWESGLNTVIVF